MDWKDAGTIASALAGWGALGLSIYNAVVAKKAGKVKISIEPEAANNSFFAKIVNHSAFEVTIEDCGAVMRDGGRRTARAFSAYGNGLPVRLAARDSCRVRIPATLAAMGENGAVARLYARTSVGVEAECDFAAANARRIDFGAVN